MAAAIAVLLALPAGAVAQRTIGGSVWSPPPTPRQGNFIGFPGFFPGFVIEDREVVHHVIEREVVHEVPAEPAAPPPPPRKPYVLGRSYSSLPGGCMKMIGGRGTYFYCSGDWYRQVGPAQYKAVSAPL